MGNPCKQPATLPNQNETMTIRVWTSLRYFPYFAFKSGLASKWKESLGRYLGRGMLWCH